VAEDVRTAGGRRLTGSGEFLKDKTCRGATFAYFSRISTCKISCKYSKSPIWFPERTSARSTWLPKHEVQATWLGELARIPKRFLAQ